MGIERVTHHAFDRIRQRFPGLDPWELATKLAEAVEREEFEVLHQVYGGKTLIRVELPETRVYALLGHSNIVSALAPGMRAFTPWGPIRLPVRHEVPA